MQSLKDTSLTKLEQEAVEKFAQGMVERFGNRLSHIDLCGMDAPGFEVTRDLQVLVLTQREDSELEDLAMDLVLDILLDTGIYLSAKTFSKSRYDTFRKAKIPMIQQMESGRTSLWKAA